MLQLTKFTVWSREALLAHTLVVLQVVHVETYGIVEAGVAPAR